jgi:hypothetical protein
MDQFGVVERIEELRSRITLIKLGLCSFKQTILALQNISKKKQNPPIISPTGILENLENIIALFETIVDGPMKTQNEKEFVCAVNFVYYGSSRLINEMVKLQSILDQRIASMGAPKLYEATPTTQIEYSGLNKVYNAVDALVYELVEKILGLDWIKVKDFVPLSLFGGDEYCISPLTHLITIPHTDCFRTRYWAMLPHEVAHIYVLECLYKETNPIRNLVAGTSFVLNAMLGIKRPIATGQIIELTCDCVGAYVCGPATALAFATGAPYLQPEGEINTILNGTHPPSDARLYALIQVMQKLGVLNDSQLKEITDFLRLFLEQKYSRLTENSANYLKEYCRISTQYAEEVVNVLQNGGFPKFEKEAWNNFISAKFQLEELSPIYLLNLAWYKRICTFEKHFDGNNQRFSENKRTERKLYESIINEMYLYYLKHATNVTVVR